jgi:biopolymer transport protein ExbD
VARSRMHYFEAKRGRVEIIPMIDVMLFLLVFFIIVTLQMIPDAGVALQLPSSTQAEHIEHPKVTVNVDKDGTLIVDGKTVTQDELVALLRAEPDPSKTQVTIAASKDVAFQQFIHALDACREAGVTDVGVATLPAGEAAAPPAAPPAGTPPDANAASPAPSAPVAQVPATAPTAPAPPAASPPPAAASPTPAAGSAPNSP